MTTLAAFRALTGQEPTNVQIAQLEDRGGADDARTEESLPEQVQRYADVIEDRLGLAVKEPERLFAGLLDLRSWEYVADTLNRSDDHVYAQAVREITPVWDQQLMAPGCNDDQQAGTREFARMVERVEEMEARLREAQQEVTALRAARSKAVRDWKRVMKERDWIEQERDACLARAQDAERRVDDDGKISGNVLVFGAGVVALAVLIFSGVLGGAG